MPATPSGRAYWIGQIRNGLSPADTASYFYASLEYFQKAGGTNRAWVRDLYREILGRAGDPGGENYWVGLADRRTPREVITRYFYGSEESRITRVTALYGRLLGRRPDPGGLQYWVGVLQNGRDVDLAMFIASGAEYFQRAYQIRR